jgi:hypothetical protein
MKFTPTRVSTAAGALALAGAAIAGVTTLGAGPASAGAGQTVAVNCQGHGQVRPSGFDNFGCMASQEFLTNLSWTSWQSVAFGQGDLKVNQCTPSCAQGHYAKFPVLTVLWRSRPWPGHAGQQYFTRITMIFTGKHPDGKHTPDTFTATISPDPLNPPA